MTRTYRSGHSPWILLLLLLAGGLAGSALTGAVAKILPVLASTGRIGLPPATVDLHFLQMTFGFTMTLSPLTALGIVLGYLVYRRI